MDTLRVVVRVLLSQVRASGNERSSVESQKLASKMNAPTAGLGCWPSIAGVSNCSLNHDSNRFNLGLEMLDLNSKCKISPRFTFLREPRNVKFIITNSKTYISVVPRFERVSCRVKVLIVLRFKLRNLHHFSFLASKN